MATYNRQSYLATVGDLPVKTGGQQLIIPGVGDDIYNLTTGELVVWNPRTGLTLSTGDIATATHVSIGVGIGPLNDLATDILHIAGDQFNLCKGKIHAEVTPPICGIPQVVDIFFDCTKCNDVYTLSLNLDDSKIRSEYMFNEKAEYIFQVATECCTCDDCSPEHNCEEVACAFVDQINGRVQKDPSKITYFRKSDLSKQYQPFTAARLYTDANSTKRFNIEVSKAGTAGITGVRINAVDYPFLNTTKPGDTSISLPSQLNRIVAGINTALENVGGSAVLKGSLNPGACYFIEVNSCATEVKLITAGGNIEPDEVSTPFDEVAQETICKGCGVEPGSISLTCGIRIFVDPIEVPCDCAYPPNLPAPNYYGRTIEPQFAGDGWVCDNHYWVQSQAQVLPTGFGYYYQDAAHYGQHNGGTGRDWRNSNRSVGRIGLPDAYSRASNAHNLIDCGETYCVYNILSNQKNDEWFNNAKTYNNTDVSYVLIPDGDATTKYSFEQYLTALQNRGTCEPGNIACGIDAEVADISGCPGESLDVSDGDTAQLTVVVTPVGAPQTGTWVSSAPSIATVSSTGLVTAVAAGSATITFTSTNGEAIDTCSVTVVA